MHLRSRSRQKATIPEASISVQFEKDETIWTESSHKYSHDELVSLAHHSGFKRKAQWIDQSWGFAENLWLAEQRPPSGGPARSPSCRCSGPLLRSGLWTPSPLSQRAPS